jgi:GR25 family glycosyltransferase involved in LPS biosynthesis
MKPQKIFDTYYYINLNRSKERKKHMQKTFKDIERIEAYDGNIIETYKEINFNNIETKISKNKLCCTLSHLKTIFQAYLDKKQEILVLEDDMNITYFNQWKLKIKDILNKKPINAECIIFYCNNEKEVASMIKEKDLFSEWKLEKNRWATGAYYINRLGMKKLYDLFYKNNSYHIKHIQCEALADHLLYYYLNTYNYTKPLFNNKLYKSEISIKKNKTQIINKHDVETEKVIKTFFK